MVTNAFTLSLTEIFYKPVIGSEFEFIEVKNVGSQSLMMDEVEIYVDGAFFIAFFVACFQNHSVSNCVSFV